MPKNEMTPILFARKHHDVSKAAHALQESLRGAFAEFLKGDVGGRSVARRLGVDKMLGWQAHRIATAPDPATIVSALPGERGMILLIEALRAVGVSDVAIGRVETATTGLWRIFDQSNASRQEIAAIAAGGLDSTAQQRHQAKVKKAHFESTVALRGEVMNATVSTWFVTPARTNPALVSLVSLEMQDGFRTIRPLGPRPVHRGVALDPQAEAGEWSRIDISADNPIPSLVPQASTPDLGPNVIEVLSGSSGTLVLADPDAYRGGSLTLTFADLIEAIGPWHATPGHRTAELSTQIATPMRDLWFDVFFDERLAQVDPSGAIYFAAGHGVEYGEHAELRRFPTEIDGRFVRSTTLPATAKVDAGMHAAMLEHGAAMIDRPLEAFRCFRMHIKHPPAFTRAVVRWLLPAAPGS